MALDCKVPVPGNLVQVAGEEHVRSVLVAPCCEGYLHTVCTQKMAIVSGKLAFRWA